VVQALAAPETSESRLSKPAEVFSQCGRWC
jgi:hypothetical protein